MEKEEVVVKIMMQVINFAANELKHIDEDYKNKLQGLEEFIQWKVGDIAYYVEIKSGEIKGTFGTAPSPSFTFEFKDAEAALEMFSGKLDISDIAKLGDKLKIIGDAKKIQELSFILLSVQENLGGLV
jgi:hypothetical protein